MFGEEIPRFVTLWLPEQDPYWAPILWEATGHALSGLQVDEKRLPFLHTDSLKMHIEDPT